MCAGHCQWPIAETLESVFFLSRLLNFVLAGNSSGWTQNSKFCIHVEGGPRAFHSVLSASGCWFPWDPWSLFGMWIVQWKPKDLDRVWDSAPLQSRFFWDPPPPLTLIFQHFAWNSVLLTPQISKTTALYPCLPPTQVRECLRRETTTIQISTCSFYLSCVVGSLTFLAAVGCATVPSNNQKFLVYILFRFYEGGLFWPTQSQSAITTPSLYSSEHHAKVSIIRKARLWKVKCVAQGHIASSWHSQGLSEIRWHNPVLAPNHNLSYMSLRWFGSQSRAHWKIFKDGKKWDPWKPLFRLGQQFSTHSVRIIWEAMNNRDGRPHLLERY